MDSLSQRWPGFDCREIHMGFVVYEVCFPLSVSSHQGTVINNLTLTYYLKNYIIEGEKYIEYSLLR
jgi:hypothetical protein